jgi:hypothetical protein
LARLDMEASLASMAAIWASALWVRTVRVGRGQHTSVGGSWP